MENKALMREVQALIAIAAKHVRNSTEARAQGGGISGLQYSVLKIIRQERQTITDISRVAMVDPSTLVPAVDALERAGLARRTKDPNDRRRTPVEITDAGRDLLARIPVLDESDALVQGLSQMSAAHREQLRGLLRELVSHLTSEAAVNDLIQVVRAEMGED
jgi:DNA-binding MarR family transcriptional regulator